MKYILTITILLLILIQTEGFAQKKLPMSQYMHNQFAINPAFAGSRETMTMFAGYRKQWINVPNSPYAQFLSAHAPLKNDNIALGFTLFNEKFAIAQNTGFSAAYTYRIRMENDSRLAFSINAGFVSSKTGWDDIMLLEPGDDAFGESETQIDPQAGFGIAWYNSRFFAGFSISDLFYKSAFEKESPFFEPSKTDFLITAGYIFAPEQAVSFQPSALLRFNSEESTILDLSANIIIHKLVWTGLTYRTNQEWIAHLGWQVSPQFRVAYSYDYPTGDLGFLNNGSHEVSIQFDFGYKIQTVSPKFF